MQKGNGSEHTSTNYEQGNELSTSQEISFNACDSDSESIMTSKGRQGTSISIMKSKGMNFLHHKKLASDSDSE